MYNRIISNKLNQFGNYLIEILIFAWYFFHTPNIYVTDLKLKNHLKN